MKKKYGTPITPSKAFQRSDNGYAFRGKKLEPFSFLRQSALIALSLEMGATRVAELAAGLWLMSSPDSVVKKARQEPSVFVDQIDAFADKNGLGSITSKDFQVARDLFDQICADVEANSAKPPSDGESDDDESGN